LVILLFLKVTPYFLKQKPQEFLIMGTHKKEANRKERQGKTGDGMGNVKTKGENFYRYVHSAIFV
jgi:hypothetical protein